MGLPQPEADPMANRLHDATSPYLLQHRDNPVDWQPWDEEALAEARQKDRPILLSIGYAACHWCHVMAHESFESEAIAQQMNEHFICIKLDREERPDLDQIYQHALALLGQQGGWPLTMFLTPRGEPFWGGTYFPPESRYGRPGLPEVLETVSRIWRTDRNRVDGNVSALGDALRGLARSEPGELPSSVTAFQAATAAVQAFDTIHGGLSGAPKFPQAPLLALLRQQAYQQGDRSLRHHFRHTLRRICQGGIYDHLGGGFARYSVDAMWLVPHFEKMLYDNALLLQLLADAAADEGDPLFRARAGETVAWLQREMMTDGAFASSLDADSEGDEGRFYVWGAGEIDEVLGNAAPSFRLAYGVTDRGNWEGRNVLNRLHQSGLDGREDEEAALRMSADRLLEARDRRTRPERDDKVLTDWNGLMVKALLRAASVFDRADWAALASAVFEKVCRNARNGDGLVHSYRQGRRLDLGFLDDYAMMADAALALFMRTKDPGYLTRAGGWVAVLDDLFWDEAGAGYHLAPETAADVLVRPKTALDGPTPSGNGTMVRVLAQLASATGDHGHLQRARRLAESFAGAARRNPLGHSTLLGSAAALEWNSEVVIVGPQNDPLGRTFHRIALRAPDADLTVLKVDGSDQLPPTHPAAGRATVDGRAAAYVCRHQSCRLPITEPARLDLELRTAVPSERNPL
jgi:uncharacterized protein YyaL (SSP411 family)